MWRNLYERKENEEKRRDTTKKVETKKMEAKKYKVNKMIKSFISLSIAVTLISISIITPIEVVGFYNTPSWDTFGIEGNDETLASLDQAMGDVSSEYTIQDILPEADGLEEREVTKREALDYKDILKKRGGSKDIHQLIN